MSVEGGDCPKRFFLVISPLRNGISTLLGPVRGVFLNKSGACCAGPRPGWRGPSAPFSCLGNRNQRMEVSRQGGWVYWIAAVWLFGCFPAFLCVKVFFDWSGNTSGWWLGLGVRDLKHLKLETGNKPP